MKSRAVIYARYSSDAQSPASIEDQLRVCRVDAEREGWDVVSTHHDAAVSGAIKDKPGLATLLGVVASGGVDIVLAESLDRLGRDLEQMARFHKHVAFAGARIVTLSEGPISELHIGLKGTMGSLYLKELSEKTRRGLEGRVRKGRAIGSPAYGYQMVHKLGESGEPDRGLRSIDPAEAAIVQRIFREYDAGVSPRSIAKHLNTEGVPGPSGRVRYDISIRGRPSRQEGILRNQLYVGQMIWNRNQTLKDPTTGQPVRRARSAAELIVIPVPGRRIVEQNLWDRVQARLRDYEAPPCPPSRRSGHPTETIAHGGTAEPAVAQRHAESIDFWDRRRPRHLISGKVICAACTRPFSSIGKDYLACLHARNGACCNTTSIRRERREAQVVAALQVQLMPVECVAAFVAEFKTQWEALAAQASAKLNTLRRDLAVVDRLITHLLDAIAEGGHSAGIRARLTETEIRRDALAAAMVHAETNSDIPAFPTNSAEIYHAKIAALQAALTGPAASQARRTARAMIDHILIHPPKTPGTPPGIELIGDLRMILQTAGLAPNTRRDQAHNQDPFSVFISSVKVAPGAEPPPCFLTAPPSALRYRQLGEFAQVGVFAFAGFAVAEDEAQVVDASGFFGQAEDVVAVRSHRAGGQPVLAPGGASGGSGEDFVDRALAFVNEPEGGVAWLFAGDVAAGGGGGGGPAVALDEQHGGVHLLADLGGPAVGADRWGKLRGGAFLAQEAEGFAAADGEVDVLRDVAAGHLGDAHGVEFGDDDAHHPPARVQQWPAGIAWLHRGADLDVQRIVAQAGERADIAGGQRRAGGEHAGEREAVGDH